MKKRMKLPVNLPSGSALIKLAQGVLDTGFGDAIVNALAGATGDTPEQVREAIARGMGAKSQVTKQPQVVDAEVVDD